MKIIKLTNFSRYPIFGLRPTSPHLTVYRFPLPAVLSVLHRATGVFLYFFVIMLFLLENMSSLDMIDYNMYYIYHMVNQSDGFIFNFLAISFFFSVYYHIFNGFRHYIWNTGKLLSLSNVYRTAYGVLTLTSILTIVTIILINLN